eukprot:6943440-Alexandrium_andersonii.AAC.1
MAPDSDEEEHGANGGPQQQPGPAPAGPPPTASPAGAPPTLSALIEHAGLPAPPVDPQEQAPGPVPEPAEGGAEQGPA